jgi:poly(glycerol-phosphate) alpha-glucosyltransferase
MKIVLVVDTMSPLAGGIFESVKGLATAMIANGEDIIVLSGRDDWSELDRPTWAKSMPKLAMLSGVAADVSGHAVTKALLDAKPDLVHVHGIWGVAARGTAAWMQQTNGHIVVSPHGMLDHWALRRSWWKKKLSQSIWEGSLLRRAHFIHALNPAEAEAIVAGGWGRPVVTIANGITLPSLPAPVQRPHGKRSLLFVGRLHPKKGVAPLIEAWAATPSAIREGWILRIAGWDEVGLLASLQALAKKLMIEDDVEFIGPVFGEEKETIFRLASAFILPSFSEGMPLAVLEAWSYGLPVFMTAACNLPKGFEVGAAFEVGVSPGTITPVLTSVLTDTSVLEAAGRKGRALVERDHVWSVIARDMRAAYTGVSQ